MRTTFPLALAFGAALALTAPALASGDAPADHGGEHTEAAAGGHGEADHGDAAHGDAAHGDAHGGHHAPGPWDDDNGNGVANFMDGEDPHYANSWGMPVYMQWLFHLANLLILVGGLGFLARKPIMAAISERSMSIKKELEDASALELSARERFEELEQRLSGFEAEVQRMKADADKAVQTERADAQKRAAEAAARVAEAAERTIRDETLRATRVLRAEAVELAVELAESTLRNEVGTDDRKRMAGAFLDSLKADATGATHG